MIPQPHPDRRVLIRPTPVGVIDPQECRATGGTAGQEVILLGSAGQRIITAGELLCIAGLTAGLKTTQKNEYNITVLRGPSISELILSPDEIDYTGIDVPSVVVALDQEGVDRRASMFKQLTKDVLIIQVGGVRLPASQARIHPVIGFFHKVFQV